MVEMRVLPVGVMLEWVGAWAELEWPVSWERAFALRDRLGWKPDPEDGRFFTTYLSADQSRADGAMHRWEGEFDDIKFPLATRVVRGQKDEFTESVTWSAFEEYLQALVGVYGEPDFDGCREGYREYTWLLANGSNLNIGALPGVMDVFISSPRDTRLLLEDARLREKYGDDYADLV